MLSFSVYQKPCQTLPRLIMPKDHIFQTLLRLIMPKDHIFKTIIYYANDVYSTVTFVLFSSV